MENDTDAAWSDSRAKRNGKKWYASSKKDLLSGGYTLIEKRLSMLEREVSTDRQREVLRRLRGYFLEHSERLCYRERLLEGRAIGSGQVEGACKSMVGKRLKQTGACWRKERANRIAILAALLYSDQWKHAWNMST